MEYCVREPSSEQASNQSSDSFLYLFKELLCPNGNTTEIGYPKTRIQVYQINISVVSHNTGNWKIQKIYINQIITRMKEAITLY